MESKPTPRGGRRGSVCTEISRKVTGVLSGFDRLVLRGTLRTLSYAAGMMNFLYDTGVLLKEFGAYVERTTKALREACEETAQQLHRPITCLPSSRHS